MGDDVLILVGDDNPVNLDVLCTTLAKEQYGIAVATDGEMVLDLVARETPDLILLDVVMPGLDGFEVCQRLKRNVELADIPIIFMTSLHETSYRVRGFQVGAIDYITKPFEEAELLARVRTHVALRRTAQALQMQNAQLQAEIQQRSAAEAALQHIAEKLLRREEELQGANETLARELSARQHSDAERLKLQEQIISAQNERLRELSTPLIPITSRIMVMPLIGTMDAERAQQVLSAALQGASERGAKVVILDITGLRKLDATVAHMLVKAADGLKLLGAQAMITGIRSEAAQVLVALNLSLGSGITKMTLQDGIAAALAIGMPTPHLFSRGGKSG